jgi:uncharacterized protein (TIGR03382 family)
MKKIFALIAITGLASGAQAQLWAEIGDAGEIVDGVQDVIGVGALNAISGTVSALDADAFRIRIKDPAAFSASAFGIGGDTTLCLFNLDGTGIAKNDDISGSVFESQLPAGNALYANLAPGEYIIAVSGFAYQPVGNIPLDGLEDTLFPILDFTGVVGPQYANPLFGWAQFSSSGGTSGDYVIELTGASFIPTPGAAALMGLAGLAGLRRRRA